MPLYEYECSACDWRWEELRGAGRADQPTPCPRCASLAERQVSTFIAGVRPRPKVMRSASASSHSAGCVCCAPRR